MYVPSLFETDSCRDLRSFETLQIHSKTTPNITVGLNKSVGANFSWKLIKKVAPNKSVGEKFS